MKRIGKIVIGIALAAGENLMGESRFAQALDSQAFGVLQPDIAKWGEVVRSSGAKID